jgi:hypothetical protein
MDAVELMVKAVDVNVNDDVESSVASSCDEPFCLKKNSASMTVISSWMSCDHQSPRGADLLPLADGRMESLPLRR